MNINHLRTDLPVLLLYNIDPSWPRQDIQECHAAAYYLKDALINIGHPVHELCVQSIELDVHLDGINPDEYLVFNWCEELPGILHSASRVALILEQMGFTYTGASVEALILSQDKRLVKEYLRAQGIPTPRWKIFDALDFITWDYYPAIVKPVFEHCSFGVTRDAVVLTFQELVERTRYVLNTFQQPALVEEFIDGREFHVSIVGNGELHILPPAEMDFTAFENVKDRLCTYESKFDPQSMSYNFIEIKLPAQLNDKEKYQIEKIAKAAYRATSCRDYARLDIRMREGIFFVLDINPNADISPDTTVALSAELAGYSYGQLGSLLVNLAAQRHPIFSSID